MKASFLISELALPARLQTAQAMSEEELFHFCAVNEHLRIEREATGELLLMSPSGFGSSRMNSRITRLLDEWAEQEGRGVTTDSTGGYRLPDGSMLAPDAAWVERKKVQCLSPADQARFAPLCPDFVIELRSESDRLPDLRAKLELWIANGVELAWLIDPQRKAVEVYRPGEEPEVHEQPTLVQGSGPVAGFELVLERIWT